MLFLSVWSVGSTAYCLRDPHQGAPPLPGLQHPSVPQGWSGASLPAHLPGVTGRSLSQRSHYNTLHLLRSWYLPHCVCLKEHRDEHLTAIPQEVCLSFVKIIQEVLGSPPDMDLLKLIYNFLLAVHPPTNTYVCHTPSSFYFSLHIGEEAAESSTSVSECLWFNALTFFWCLLFARWEVVSGEGAVHNEPETLKQWRKIRQQLCHVTLPNCLHWCSPWRYNCLKKIYSKCCP